MACHWFKFRDAAGVEHTGHIKLAKPRRRKCAFCTYPDARSLCDYRLANGRTCDKPLCDQHRVQDGDKDYCIAHDLTTLARRPETRTDQESLF